jgi:hypothetical protein
VTSDMSQVIIPRSDQLNSDDLISGPITIRITKVEVRPGTEQPVSIFFEGDNGKPYKCCKSMSRVMVSAWGPDSSVYAGRSLTLFRDPKVKWGGMEVGGIRISHMSHITGSMTLALTETKQSRKPFTVQPLATPKAPNPPVQPKPASQATTAQPAPTPPASEPESPPADDDFADLELYGDGIEFTITDATDGPKLRKFWSSTISNPTWDEFKAAHGQRSKDLKAAAMDKIKKLSEPVESE